MIKYYVNEDKRQVIGVLDNTRYDAVNKMGKMLRDTNFAFCPREKYMMPSCFKAVVTCDPADEFNIQAGKDKAKERIMTRYYNSFDKRMDYFLADLNDLCGKFFENP